MSELNWYKQEVEEPKPELALLKKRCEIHSLMADGDINGKDYAEGQRLSGELARMERTRKEKPKLTLVQH